MVALMSHFPMKGQDFAHFSLFRFFSLYVLSFTMIFLFNWLVSPSFFSYGSPLIWKENATWFSLVFLLFHLPLCSLPQSSISLFFSISFSLPLAWLSPPFVDAQCSRALNHGSVLVGLPLSSSGFWILAFSPVGSRRIAGRGDKVEDEDRRTWPRESADLSYLNVNDPMLLHSSSYLLLPLVTQRQ